MNEAEFQIRVRQALDPVSPSLLETLRRLLAQPYPHEVESLSFEVFPESFTSGFPVRCFFIDEHNNEFFLFHEGKAEYPSSVDPGLLKLERVYDLALEEEFEGTRKDADVWMLACEVLIAWFAECFEAAGGLSFERRAVIRVHDEPREFDLVHGLWNNI